MTIKDTILEQKKELALRIHEPYIPRDAEIGGSKTRLIKIIIGPRRAGKSFFLTRYLTGKGVFGYVNFDDEQLTDPEKIPDILAAVNDVYQGSRTLLLDEYLVSIRIHRLSARAIPENHQDSCSHESIDAKVST